MVGNTTIDPTKTRILLIEENGKGSEVLETVLNAAIAAGFAMERTKTLADGLKVLNEGGADLVVMDIVSAGSASIAAFNQVKELAGKVPLVVLSSGNEDQASAAMMKIGAQDYLRKSSLDPKTFVQSLRHAVDMMRVEAALKDATLRLEAATSRLETLANVDALTEVLNRIGLERALQSEFSRAQRQGWNLVAALLDCDDFDRINASLGHAVGDVVLREISGRLRDTLRPTDHIARIGSDEFLMLLPDTRLAEGMLVAEKVRLAVADSPLRLATETIRVTASLGVLALPYDFCSIEEVLSLCRLAVRESKMLGKNRVSISEKDKKEHEPNREALTDLTDLLRKGDCFRAVSMPIFKLDEEKVVGYEILSRGPAGAFEMPDDLFRISVENNLLTIVDLRCLKTCLAACVLPKFDQKARFHVNLFPSTIIDTPIDRLMTLFPDDGVTREYCVEISEQQFIGDPAYLRDHVLALKERGILVSIDDVGFGRSSLESLIILEPDIVKIDRKYVTGIASEPSKARLLKRLVKVVNSLGADVIAEGIEEREELEMLVDIGVPYGQGWYWGKPA
ncbi:MAG: EAL domain-containing protein [Candidatus Obscuribacterales bacterium]|nr:EAL domain-containing protein [Candidatus Obscuribacterales bacterium]